MRRGEVWWANLGRPRGSAPGYRRPVVIVQSDDFNRSDLRTVVAAGITSNMKLALAPGRRYLMARRPELYARLTEPLPEGQTSVTKPGWDVS